MFRIRRMYDAVSLANRDALRQITAITRAQFPRDPPAEIDKLPAQLHDPLRYRCRSVVLVAEDQRGRVRGYALVLHLPDLQWACLELLSAAPGGTGGGIGGALYERVREEAFALDCRGLCFECEPDTPDLCPDAARRRQNAARLRFYERYGARPVEGTDYAAPVHPGDHRLYLLVYDDLGGGRPFRRDDARAVVRAILERKYGDVCPPAYTARVVASFREDPVRLRPRRYASVEAAAGRPPAGRPVALVVSDAHEIHHVRERGYLETPVRVKPILAELDRMGGFRRLPARAAATSDLLAVHDRGLVEYLRRACEGLPSDRPIYPEVFPVRNAARPPRHLPFRAGYYCIDPVTPLTGNAYRAARRAVDCAMTGAHALLEGYRLAYALVRPPGHHAERRSFGGFCYFNNAAVAAHHLSRFGRVAVLDVDYHHGNGQQDIFYRRADVLTVSIHAHPRVAYPHFSGFADERGEGRGKGFNLNLPLPERVDGERYLQALEKALARIRRFTPAYLVVCLGLDTARSDPTGTWSLVAADFRRNGDAIGRLQLPTLVVQEGGYRVRTLGVNTRHFFAGLRQGAAG